MSTGATRIGESLATGLRFASGRMVVEFDDGREVSVPLRLYPTLQRATSAQRKRWELIGPGKAFHWEHLDLDLSVRGIISGLPELIPAPPKRPRQRKAAAAAR